MREDRASAANGAAPSPSSASRIPRPTTSADGPDADLLAAPSAKASCLFPPGEGGDCLERDDSSVGCQRDRDDGDGSGSTFFDSLSRQWVRVDNFAFAQSDNHFRDQLYKIGLPGKSILGDYFQENMTSRRPFLLLRISFPGRPIFIQSLLQQQRQRWGRGRGGGRDGVAAGQADPGGGRQRAQREQRRGRGAGAHVRAGE